MWEHYWNISDDSTGENKLIICVKSQYHNLGCIINIRVFTHLGHFWDANSSYIMILEHSGTTQKSEIVDSVGAFMGNIFEGVFKLLTAFFTLQGPFSS